MGEARRPRPATPRPATRASRARSPSRTGWVERHLTHVTPMDLNRLFVSHACMLRLRSLASRLIPLGPPPRAARSRVDGTATPWARRRAARPEHADRLAEAPATRPPPRGP